MDNLIRRYIEMQPNAVTVDDVYTVVTSEFKRTKVETQDLLDDLVDSGSLVLVFFDGKTLYKIAEPLQDKTIDRLILDFIKSHPEGSTTEGVVRAVVDPSLGNIKTEHVLDILEDLISDELIFVDIDDSRMLLKLTQPPQS